MKRLAGFATELLTIARSRTSRQSLVVLLGNGFSAGLSFAATVLVSRLLGPAAWGDFSSAYAVLSLASDLSDLGMNTGLTRFASLFISRNHGDQATTLFNIALKIRLLVGTLVFLLVFGLAQPLATYGLGKPDLVVPIRIAIGGIFGGLLLGAARSLLQSYQRFGRLVLVTGLLASFRLVALLGLISVAAFSLLPVLGVYVAVPLIASLAAVSLLPRGSVRIRAWDPELARRLVGFSKWITLSFVCVSLTNRLDIFMLTRLTDSGQVGIYSSAYKLAFMFPVITGALTMVLLPRAAALSDWEQIRHYLGRVMLLAIPAGVLLPVVLLVAGPLVRAIFGAEYQASIPIFRILLAGFAISIVANPISLVFYSLDRPQLLTLLNAIQLLFAFLANLVLIPRWGGIGAGWTVLGVRVITLLFFGIYFMRHMPRHSRVGDRHEMSAGP